MPFKAENTLNNSREFFDITYIKKASQVASAYQNSGDARDEGLIPGSGRSSVEGNGHRLQYSYLENSMDRKKKIPWTEEPGRVWSMGLQRIGLD